MIVGLNEESPMKIDCPLVRRSDFFMTYVTVLGDTWDIISKKVYGTEFHTDVLMKANPDKAAEVIFSSGVQLILPEIDAIEQFDNLPPWKRVNK